MTGFAVTPDVPPQSQESLAPLPPNFVSGNVILAGETSAQGFDSFPVTAFRATKYVLTLSQNGAYEAVELLVLQDGTNTYLEAYGAMSSTGPLLATFAAQVAIGQVLMTVSLVSSQAASLSFQAVRIAV